MPVLVQDPRSLDLELARLAHADLLVVLVDHPHPVAGEREPDRVAEPEREERRRDLGGDASADLDHAVALEKRRLAHRPDHGQRRRGAELHLQPDLAQRCCTVAEVASIERVASACQSMAALRPWKAAPWKRMDGDDC